MPRAPRCRMHRGARSSSRGEGVPEGGERFVLRLLVDRQLVGGGEKLRHGGDDAELEALPLRRLDHEPALEITFLDRSPVRVRDRQRGARRYVAVLFRERDDDEVGLSRPETHGEIADGGGAENNEVLLLDFRGVHLRVARTAGHGRIESGVDRRFHLFLAYHLYSSMTARDASGSSREQQRIDVRVRVLWGKFASSVKVPCRIHRRPPHSVNCQRRALTRAGTKT